VSVDKEGEVLSFKGLRGSIRGKKWVPLGLKLSLLLMFLIIGITLILTFFFIRRQTQYIKMTAVEFAQFVAENAAHASLNFLVTSDYNSLDNLVKKISRHPDIEKVAIVESATNRIAATNDKDLLGKKADVLKTYLVNKEKVFVGEKNVIVTVPIQESGEVYGYLVLWLKLDRAFAEISKARNFAVGMGVFAVVIAIFLGFLFMKKTVITPIQTVIDGMQKVAGGDLDYAIDLRTNDEFEIVANNFNKMTKNVSVLYYISQVSNYSSNVESLLKVILEKAIEVTNAERGSLLLISEDGMRIETKLVVGLSEEAAGFVSFELGEGVAGQVAQTQRAVIVNLGAKDPRFKLKAEWSSNVRNLLVVPMVYHDELVGVLNIVNKRDGDFTEGDLNIVKTMATQAASAILKAKLYEASITDGLTGLFVHKYFQVRLAEEIKRIKRYGGSVSLVMTDVDHFKSFNDTYGHQQGDIVLKYVAKLIKETVRQNVDVPCRYGGEEFAVIMPNTDSDGALTFAERLRKKVEEFPFPGQEKPLHVTISIGVATAPDDADDKLDLIKKADMALYFSKENGRNRVTAWRDITDKVSET